MGVVSYLDPSAVPVNDTFDTADCPINWTITGSGSPFVVETTHTPGAVKGLTIDPAMTTSFRRGEYTSTKTSGKYGLMFRFKVHAFSSVATFFASCRGLRSSDNAAATLTDFRIDTGGATRTITARNVSNGTVILGSTAAFLALETDYRCEIIWDIDNDTQEIRFYNGTDAVGATPVAVLSYAFAYSNQIDAAYFGVTSAAAGAQITFWDVAITNAFNGPLVPPSLPDIPNIAVPAAKIIAHRAITPGPSCTVVGHRRSKNAYPWALWDVDLQLLIDLTATAIFHDPNLQDTAGLVDPSSPITIGEVDQLTKAQFDSVLITDPQGGTQPSMDLADLVALFGLSGGEFPGAVGCLEVKTTTPYANAIPIITATGLQQHTFAQSFSFNAAGAMADAGWNTMLICGVTAPDYVATAARRIKWVAFDDSIVDATLVNTAHTNGLKIMAYTVNSKVRYDALIAMGVDLVASDVPGTLYTPPVVPPMPYSVDDLERLWLLNDYGPGGDKLSLGDLDFAYWAKRSGLLPAAAYDLTIHKLAALRNAYDAITGDRGLITRRNFCLNPRGLQTSDNRYWFARYSWTKTFVTGEAEPRPTSVRYTSPALATGVTGRGVDILYNTEAPSPTTNPVNFPQQINPGDQVSVSVDGRWSQAFANTTLILRFHDGNGNWTSGYTVGPAQAVVANTWATHTCTAQAPEGSKYWCATLRQNDAQDIPAGVTLDTTNILIERNASGGVFFYGGDSSKNTRWAGAANASISEYTDPSKNSCGDLWMDFLEKNSGLGVGPGKTGVDHEIAYYKTVLGLP